tara:strand:+ start:1699 stop:1956 length:258 start_codon:yes stop_codon:yes gene_type:complete
MADKKRNYRKEYDNYQGKPEQIKKRGERVKARRLTEKEGRVHKGDKKDVAHKNNDTSDNSKSNRGVQSESRNRSFPRDKNAKRKK